ncbi:hypothetical protein OEZ85_009018 [Tetradesmus obliquus]|uniref:CRAL-TRIO domain-containing protein n=1 Tax=Tetradesmus obliquus TaxID=3088 RepID=A0ABY8TKI6_TETOB|nr:hypothetical protein OEZ85_009018 [Tetradesmus obliquus]
MTSQEGSSSGGYQDPEPAAAAAAEQEVEHFLQPHAPHAAAGAAKQLPVFISDPEPAWLTPDIKQRYLHAAFTVRGAKQNARQAHEWRQKFGVDGAFERPVPYHTAVTTAFPTYTLMDESPERHAVITSKVGCIKDLCNLVFHPPDGTAGVPLEDLEYTMAVLNEYLTKVAAPRPLPGGSQVQIFDLEGFKLSMVNGELITLFKMLGRFVQYYPERVHAAFVINAPRWFATPWKLLSSFLDANTKSRVMVVADAKEILPVLAHHLGGMHNVPQAWGGSNTTPFHDYPAHQRMLAFAKKLNEGQQQQQQQQQQ